MGYSLHDIVGNLGVLLIVGSYFLVQIGRLSATEPPYIVVNGLGAALILYSLSHEFNMSAFLIEVIWLLISVMGLVRYYLGRRREQREASEPPR